ncbi:hypothetical protein ACLOJK_032486 [Asimina triloba]
MERFSEQRYPVSSTEYKLHEEVGEGVSATVYRALCVPLNETVAIKVLDLEKCNNDLDGIRREVQTMSLIDHPNVLRAHCSFTTDRSLWVVMPYMDGGSCLHIMKSAYPEGFEEPVIATLLREVLKALVYLHGQGHIHRDVKAEVFEAGNILIDGYGTVKLGDFGVSACMFDTGDRQRADIWSFGITALELAHGHTPFSKYPPMKVLLMTLQNAPPGLDYERDKRFSKSFKEMVAACLVKDPKKRPTSEKLLKHHFFKHARSNEYLARTILSGLRPLGERFRMLKAKEADFLAQQKVMYGDNEQLSQATMRLSAIIFLTGGLENLQQEYIRGISGWNFNLEDLKTQAALIQGGDEISNTEYPVTNKKGKNESNGVYCAPNVPLTGRDDDSKVMTAQKDGLQDLTNAEGSVRSFPIGYFDVCEDDVNGSSCNCKDALQSDSEKLFQLQQSQAGEQETTRHNEQETGRHNGDAERNSSLPQNIIIPGRPQKFFSGSLLPEHVLSSSRKVDADGDSDFILVQIEVLLIGNVCYFGTHFIEMSESEDPPDNLQRKYPRERYYSGPLSCRQKREININTAANLHALDDKSQGTVVQRKGRFKVTSDVSPKGAPNRPVSPVGQASNNSNIAASFIHTSLQNMLQQNALQRVIRWGLLRSLQATFHSFLQIKIGKKNYNLRFSICSKALDSESSLDVRIETISEELQMLKLRNAEGKLFSSLECSLDACIMMQEAGELIALQALDSFLVATKRIVGSLIMWILGLLVNSNNLVMDILRSKVGRDGGERLDASAALYFSVHLLCGCGKTVGNLSPVNVAAVTIVAAIFTPFGQMPYGTLSACSLRRESRERSDTAKSILAQILKIVPDDHDASLDFFTGSSYRQQSA